jgi:acetamidase/formamidase
VLGPAQVALPSVHRDAESLRFSHQDTQAVSPVDTEAALEGTPGAEAAQSLSAANAVVAPVEVEGEGVAAGAMLHTSGQADIDGSAVNACAAGEVGAACLRHETGEAAMAGKRRPLRGPWMTRKRAAAG